MVNHDSSDLHKGIHDFYPCRPVDFVIMDGLQGIQNGPTPCYEVSGTSDIKQDQMNIRLILAGRDAVAVDTIEALLMNWDPLSVGHLCYLNQSGGIPPEFSALRRLGFDLVFQLKRNRHASLDTDLSQSDRAFSGL